MYSSIVSEVHMTPLVYDLAFWQELAVFALVRGGERPPDFVVLFYLLGSGFLRLLGAFAFRRGLGAGDAVRTRGRRPRGELVEGGGA